MRTRHLPVAALALLALLAGLGVRPPPADARRGVAIMDQVTRMVVEQLCPDGVRLLLGYKNPDGLGLPETSGFNLVAVRQRDPLNGGILLDYPVRLTPLDPPVVGGDPNDPDFREDLVVGQRIEQRWEPGEARPGDRLVFFRSNSNLARVETVGACSLADPPRLRNPYQPTERQGSTATFTIEDPGIVTNVAVEFWINAGVELGEARLTLRAPDGATATLLSPAAGQSIGLSIGTNQDFSADVDYNRLVDGQPNPNFGRIDSRGGGPAIFDDAVGASIADVRAPYTSVALRSAGPDTLLGMRGRSLAGTWTLTISSPAGDPAIDYAALMVESLPLSARGPNAVWLPAVLSAGGGGASATALTIYDNRLAEGWSSAGWSYGAVVAEFAQLPTARSAPNALGASFTQGYGGLVFRSAEPIEVAGRYRALRLWVRGAPGGSRLSVYSQTSDEGEPSSVYSFTAPGDAWAQVSVPLSALGSPATLKRIAIQDESGAPGGAIYVDDVRLIP